MTERSLMIRYALLGRYFAVGMDFPTARVFDVATGSLAAVVEVPPRSRSSLAVVSLTTLALGNIDVSAVQAAEEDELRAVDVVDVAGGCYAAVGLSNGTVLLHNVSKDVFVQHLAVSDTQQAITAAVFCGRYLFCVAANRSLHIVDCLRGERVAANLRVQYDAGAIAVMECTQNNNNNNNNNDHANGGIDVGSVFLVFVSGPTNAVYTVRLASATTARAGGVVMERMVSFASQATRSDCAWMGGTMQRPVVVTACAQEGVVRVWDAAPSLGGAQGTSSRCRRSLLCGQRIVHISVHDTRNNNNNNNNNNNSEAFVVATTLTGAVLVWNLGRTLLTSVAEPAPTPPTLRIVSKEMSGRLLFGAFLQNSEVEKPSLLVLRGRFALPHFEVVDLHEVTRKATRAHTSTSLSPSTIITSPLLEDAAVYEMPAGTKSEKTGGVDAVHADMEVLDNTWATHCRQQQQQQQRLAAHAASTPSEGFAVPVPFHAKSVKDIPQKGLTLEQRLRQLSISSSSQKQKQEQGAQQQQQQHALGLATVPLYQALHANDASAVMELLTVASRSADDTRATVMGLQLPYCLQLLQILSHRVRGANSRSPLFEWIDAIIHYRGVEMYQAQQLIKRQNAEKEDVSSSASCNGKKGVEKSPLPTSVSSSTPSTTAANPSPPKDFVAPLLHQYRSMAALYDPLAAMYGRLSVFKSVRPSEKSLVVNSDAGIIFPKMFTEIRCAGGEYRALRVRSKRDPHLKKNKKAAALALLRKARRLVAAEEDDEAVERKFNAANDNDDDLDLDDLDQMNLEDENSEHDNDDNDDDNKDADGERTEMIADVDRGSSYGVESSRSGEAEFDAGSDDTVNTEEDDDDDYDDDSNSSDDDESSSSSSSSVSYDVLDDNEDEEDDEDDEDDGMGEDMAELLAAQGEGEQLEGRRHKRVRTDH